MKNAHTIKILLSLIPLLLLTTTTFANELDSTNYKLIGVTTTGGGGIAESTGYKLLATAGDTSADPRNYSTNYRMNQDPSAIFTAAQPTVQCFETDTDGTTNCTSGPSELLYGGMVAICGSEGCYDKARFEIQPYTNPDDTLYIVHISEDNFSTDIQCIDASTFRPKTISSCNINDFRTETFWETEVFNIQGLEPNTQYNIRISALHGDFTQSDFSKTETATTTLGSISFDIDIATNTGYDTETSAPHTISFSNTDKLIAGAPAVTASSLIWLDVSSSSSGGIAIIQYGKNGGLYSSTTSTIIQSEDEDLDIAGADGFGLQNYYIDYEESEYLGDITATYNYAQTQNVVGQVSTTGNKIYDGDGPINSGRLGLLLKARAPVDITPETDYTEDIYFILVPRY